MTIKYSLILFYKIMLRIVICYSNYIGFAAVFFCVIDLYTTHLHILIRVMYTIVFVLCSGMET